MSLEAALEECDWLLCGTGWQSDFERVAILLGKEAKIKTIAFLDHWVNYTARFLDNGRVILPDEIWVGDEHAKEIAEKEFPEIRVALQPNPYVDDLMRELDVLKIEGSDSSLNKGNILYVCEPVREHALRYHGDERYWGYTEEEALKYFLHHIPVLFFDVTGIVLRPHPSEPAGKYELSLIHI